jgi:hypothetical protein
VEIRLTETGDSERKILFLIVEINEQDTIKVQMSKKKAH